MVRIFVVVASCLLAALPRIACAAEQIVETWASATEMDADSWMKSHQPRLRAEVARMRARWDSLSYESVSYIMVIRTYGLIQDTRCEQVGIRATIVEGKATNARYARTGDFRCLRGHRVNPRINSREFKTPADLFALVEEAATQNPAHTGLCIDAEFDLDTGLPKKLDIGCPWVFDAAWSVRISEIELH